MACMGLSVHAATRPPMPRDTPASISIFPSRPTPRRAAVRHCSTPARRSSLHMRHRQPQLSPSTHSPSHAWCPPPFARGLTTFNQRLRSRPTALTVRAPPRATPRRAAVSHCSPLHVRRHSIRIRRRPPPTLTTTSPLHAPHPSLGRVDNRPPSTTPARYGSHGTYASVS